MKLHTISFGCQMAFADTEEMSRPFLERGCALTPELEEADAVLVNTCTVREHAEHRAISQIGRLRAWKEARPERLLIVAGCAAERMKDDLRKRFDHIDLVVGAKSIEDFPKLVEEAIKGRFAGEFSMDGADLPSPYPLPKGEGESAFVTIMRGCNYSCTYCIVPAVRGREIYRDEETILAEVRQKVAAGAREVMLLGQTVNSWKRDGRDFADLLRAVDAVEGLERVRFMSPHPFFLNPRMIDAMAGCAKVARELHLPVQSGSDRMLKAMRRNYTRAQYAERVAALRRAVPGLSLTTDFIVGFPGETEADFAETMSLLDEIGFDAAFCFKYSPRAGTDAAAMEDTVPESLKERRLDILLDAVRRRVTARGPRLRDGAPMVL